MAEALEWVHLAFTNVILQFRFFFQNGMNQAVDSVDLIAGHSADGR